MKTQRSAEQGVALITTMIVVAVLAVVAVAFMQSTSTDRLSSRTAVNYVQARLVAEAGAAAGEALVARLVKAYPDSVTVWQNIGGGPPAGTNNEATVLYLRAQSADTNLGALPWQSGGAVSLLAHPLVSGASLVPLGSAAASMPFSAGDTNMVNLNLTNAARPRPFVGSRSMTNTGSPVAAAQWVYMGARPGPTNATNPAIARYAFWVEDESFKVNVNFATNGPRGTASLGLNPSEARLDGAWGSSRESGLSGANFSAVITGRDGLPGSNFPTALTAALPGQVSDAASLDDLRFLTTVHSAGLDLSRGGFKRFNINSVTNGDKRTGLNRIIAAITNTNASPLFGQRFYRLANNTNGINKTNVVTNNHPDIYLNKIAANIYDYVDADDQPTVINNDATFTLRTGRPTEPIMAVGGGTDGSNSVAAFGIENGPRLQEFGYHVRMWKMSWDSPDSKTNFGFSSTVTNVPAPTQANFEMWIDYYFEFYNPGTKDVTISDAFVQLDKLPAFRGVDSSHPLYNERSITAQILGGTATFPAGQVTVLTTAPFLEESVGASTSTAILTNRSNLVYLDVLEADRKFTGVTTKIAKTNYNPADGTFNPSPNFDRIFEVTLVPGPQNKGSMLLGNDSGILESFVGLPLNPQTNANSTIEFRVANGSVQSAMMNIARGNKTYVRGGSLRGNSLSSGVPPSQWPNSTEGDARALNEQLEFLNFGASANTEQTRFYSSISDANGTLPGDSTFGRLNTNFVFAANWTDRNSSWRPDSTNAPLYVRNAALQSIGELGHITDPARVPGSSGDIALARGGGRTLRVGQPELSSMASPWRMAWYDGNQTNASRTWTSWRLADIFTTTAASNSGTAANAQGILTNSLGVVRGTTNTNGAVVTIPGLLNPNGALRDNGAALKAVLHGLTFLPSSDTNNGGAAIIDGRTANVTNVVTNLIGRLTNATGGGLPANSLNPFWERGELSELSVLNAALASTVVSGQVMSNVIDRGREELIRRSIEMITPRGSVFSVYAIGETLQGTNVTGTARLKQTFEIQPVFRDPADAINDSFEVSASGLRRRFAPPANYTVRVLATSYD